MLAALHAQAFGMAGIGRAIGLLHDIGKAAQEYLAYISAPPEDRRKGPDHSTAGAREAIKFYGPILATKWRACWPMPSQVITRV